MRIANIEIPHGLFLGPMAGFSDNAMRKICKEYGAEYLVTEMISAKALCFHDQKTFQLAKIDPYELPCALQLFGHEPDVLSEAVKILQESEKQTVFPSAIDINMGCPVQKIVSSGDGSSLMKNPLLVEQIVNAVKKQFGGPVTVKIRAGWDFLHLNAPEIAQAAEAGGADAIFVHGRTKTQQYSGNVNLEIIKLVKKSVKIPVIGNGDIKNAESALKMLSETGCNGIMVGRGAIGNPFVFQEIKACLENKSYTPPSWEEKRDVAIRQLQYAIEDKGEEIAIREARKQIPAYLHGLRAGSRARLALTTSNTFEEMKNILLSFQEE